MTIQDVKYIAEIAKCGSINRAAKGLYVPQPSLSKCIQKVEQEYDVKLFYRNRGSAMKLTMEGACFLEMAQKIMDSHEHFQEQIRRLKFRNQSNIVFGTTMQRAYDLAGPFLKLLYENYKQYFVEIRTNKTAQLEKLLLDGSIDMALISAYDYNEELYYEQLYSTWQWIYLRRGSPAREKAVKLENLDYPVLRLEDLEGEDVVANTLGSSSRMYLENVIEETGVNLNIIELSNRDNRMAMAESGKASYFIRMEPNTVWSSLDEDLIYFLHPDQNVESITSLVCRQGVQKDVRFQAVLECMIELHKNGIA